MRLDLASVVDRQKVGRFHVGLVLLCLLITVADGYDIVALGFVGPALLKHWSLPPEALAPLFTVGLVGGLLGPALFGYLGDRFGRKALIVGGTFLMGVFTLASAWAPSLEALIALRFVAGIGMTGVLPTTVALLTEYSPARVRSTFTILGYCGVTLGGIVAGLVAVNLLKQFGWESVLIIGGIVPIVAALLAWVFLPESAKFLALRAERRAGLAKVLGRLDPSVDIASLAAPAELAKPDVRVLLSPELRAITLLFWGTALLGLAGIYFFSQWMPVLLTRSGLSVPQAAMVAMLFQLGGLIGSLAIMGPLDRYGYAPIAVFFTLAVPCYALIGTPGLPFLALCGLSVLAGIFGNGVQLGNVSMQGRAYPTAIRATGLGACFVASRLGSIVGPALVGALLARHWGVQSIFLAAAALPAAAAILAFLAIPKFKRLAGAS